MPIASIGKRSDPVPQRTDIDQTTVAHNAPRAISNRERVMLLNNLIEGMPSRKIATERQIRAAVTRNEWDRYNETKRSAKQPKMPKNVRQQFSRYNALLRSGDRRFDGAENSAGSSTTLRRSRRPNLQSPYQLAERDYEHALEVLEDLLQCEPCALAFLDRPVWFGLGNAPNPDQESVPRLITSLSPYRLQDGKRWQSNRELRLSTLLASRDKLLSAMARLGSAEDMASAHRSVKGQAGSLTTQHATIPGHRDRPIESENANLTRVYTSVVVKI